MFRPSFPIIRHIYVCVCISLRSTWSHLEWLELSWTHLDSMNLNRTHLISLGPIWTVTVPLAVAAAEVAVVFASHSFCCSFDKTPCRSSARSFDEHSLQPPAAVGCGCGCGCGCGQVNYGVCNVTTNTPTRSPRQIEAQSQSQRKVNTSYPNLHPPQPS